MKLEWTRIKQWMSWCQCLVQALNKWYQTLALTLVKKLLAWGLASGGLPGGMLGACHSPRVSVVDVKKSVSPWARFQLVPFICELPTGSDTPCTDPEFHSELTWVKLKDMNKKHGYKFAGADKLIIYRLIRLSI